MTHESKPHEHGTDFHDRVLEIHGPAAESFLKAHLSLMHDAEHLDRLTRGQAEALHRAKHEPHIHEDSPSTWSISQLRRHLLHGHDINFVMSWDIGRLHQAHLDAHQAAKRATPTAEEALMPDHSNQFVPTVQSLADSRPADADDGPRKMYEASEEHRVFDLPWDRLGQESRDFWRGEYARKCMSDAVRSARHQPVRPTGPQEQHAERRILVDRFTAAMAGLNFDRDWAADTGIGPNARGALRVTFQRAAEQLLYTLERGGLLPFGPLTEVEQGNLDRLREERDGEIRRRLAAEKIAGELRLQMAEQHRSMQEMAQAQAESEHQIGDLENTIDVLREQLEMTQTASTNLQQQVRGLTARRDEALETLGEVSTERDEWRQEAHRTASQLAIRTRGLEEGRARLQALVSDLEREGWDESAVFRRLKEILGEPVSTVTAASPVRQPTLRETIEQWRPADQQGTPWPEGREDEDDLSWARRFAQGGEA